MHWTHMKASYFPRENALSRAEGSKCPMLLLNHYCTNNEWLPYLSHAGT